MLTLALDGNSLAYRAFFALPEDMATASGQATNAVYGFTTMLLMMLKEHKPDRIVVVFDRPEPTFRHEAIPEYKAQREKAPDTLHQQLGMIRELLDVLGIVHIEMPGFEGDDIIATLATRIEADNDDVIIVTGDRDSYQLVKDPHVRVMYNKRGVSDYALYDEAGIIERTGVTPGQYADYAALRGDPSDNLDGVPGVGEKTAAKLLVQYGTLDEVLAHAKDQTPKLSASLAEHGDRVRRNARMMVLRRDVPIDVDLRALVPSPDLAGLQRFFDFCEFRTMYKRAADTIKQLGWIPRTVGTSSAPTPSSSQERTEAKVTVATSVADTVAALSSAPLTVVARWHGDPGRSDIGGFAVVTDASSGAVTWCNASHLRDVAVVKALASARDVQMHDAKPFMRALLGIGIDIEGLTIDTAIAAYLVDPSMSSYSLNTVCAKYIGDEPRASVEATGQFDFGTDAPGEEYPEAEQALYVAELAKVLRDRLDSDGVRSLYDDVENPLVRVLARMEHFGIGVDAKALAAIRDKLTSEVAELTSSLHAIAGKEFNVNSPTQLREILYTDKGLTPGKKTKTGYSTDAATLEKLRGEWPEFIEPLLRFREVEKLRSTYGEGLLAEVASDGRIHATFNQTVARTGRLSSDRPNLHNIPVRSDEGRVFRTAFVPSSACELLVADYNQIELRCIAHLAGDPGLIAAFNAGQDIHTATAARVFGVDPTKVSHDQRSKAKMVSYGLAYGMEAYGLSQRLAIGVDEAAGILNAYFDAFPNVKKYMDKTVHEARQRGYTETLFGRRRPIPELLSDNFRIRQAGERQAMNAAIQGLAADIFKIALVRIDRELAVGGLAARLVLQVHDEVLVEAPTAEKEQVEKLVIDIMRGAASLDVPLEINFAWGDTWGDAKG